MPPLQRLLEQSIVDPMPPFESLDDLIGRERRRRRHRRLAGAGTAAVAILAAIGATVLLGAPAAAPPPAAPPSASSTFVPPPRGPEAEAETVARLEAALRARISDVAAGATLSGATPFLRIDFVTFADRVTYGGKGSVTTADGESGIAAYMVRPEKATPAVPYGGSLLRLYGGCAAMPTVGPDETASCEEHTTAAGVRVRLAAQRRRHFTSFSATAVFPDGSAVFVEVTGEGVEPIVRLEQLAVVVVDPELIP
jgi:hypothetical protein